MLAEVRFSQKSAKSKVLARRVSQILTCEVPSAPELRGEDPLITGSLVGPGLYFLVQHHIPGTYTEQGKGT